jgi:serine/threonine protein phosphatase PrpC
MASYQMSVGPFSPPVRVDVFGISNKGLARETNGDHFLVVRAARSLETVFTSLTETQPGKVFEESGYGLVVADGVADGSAGEMASRKAIYTLLNLALHTSDWQFQWGPKERNTVLWRMKERFHSVNKELLRDVAAHATLTGMCTTMTAAVTYGSDAIIGHIGDSSAYLLHQGKLIRLTRDHSLGGRLVEEGIRKPNDPLVLEFRGLLLQTLGSLEGECHPDVHNYLLQDGDQLLLCTDGLTDMVGEADIEGALNNASSAKSACQRLVDLSVGNGGDDNVTVIVARYSISVK